MNTVAQPNGAVTWDPGMAKACFPNADIRCNHVDREGEVEQASHVCGSDEWEFQPGATSIEIVSQCTEHEDNTVDYGGFDCGGIIGGIVVGIIVMLGISIACCVMACKQPTPPAHDEENGMVCMCVNIMRATEQCSGLCERAGDTYITFQYSDMLLFSGTQTMWRQLGLTYYSKVNIVHAHRPNSAFTQVQLRRPTGTLMLVCHP